jgi:short-subunit dehydrogenase
MPAWSRPCCARSHPAGRRTGSRRRGCRGAAPTGRRVAIYAASKHAVEGYSESLDHEVREHGVRVLLVQSAVTNTPVDTNMVQADTRCRSTHSSAASSAT